MRSGHCNMVAYNKVLLEQNLFFQFSGTLVPSWFSLYLPFISRTMLTDIIFVSIYLAYRSSQCLETAV